MKYDSLNNPSTNYLTDQSVSEIKFLPNADKAGISFRFRNMRITFVGDETKMISVIDKVKAVGELSGTDTVKFEALVGLLMSNGAVVEKFELVKPPVSALTNTRNFWDQSNIDSILKWDSATEFYNK